MNSKVYKWCVVAHCKNTSIKTPDKLFVYVPNKKKIREKWLTLARRDPTSLSVNSSLHFCEDHFDLPNDMENYMKYHLMGSVSRVLMKPGCFPTKFECHIDRRKRTGTRTERPYFVKIQRRVLIEEFEKDLKERNVIKKLDSCEADSPTKGSIQRPKLKSSKSCAVEIKVEEVDDDENLDNISETTESTLHDDLIKQEITIDEDFENYISSAAVPVSGKEKDPLANNQDNHIITIVHDHDYGVAGPTETVPHVPVVSTKHQGSLYPTMLIGPLLTSHIHSDLHPKSSEGTAKSVEHNDLAVRLEQEIARNASLKQKVKALHMQLKRRDEQIKSLKAEMRKLKSKR